MRLWFTSSASGAWRRPGRRYVMACMEVGRLSRERQMPSAIVLTFALDRPRVWVVSPQSRTNAHPGPGQDVHAPTVAASRASSSARVPRALRGPTGGAQARRAVSGGFGNCACGRLLSDPGSKPLRAHAECIGDRKERVRADVRDHATLDVGDCVGSEANRLAQRAPLVTRQLAGETQPLLEL
jgi:hypothetical protein